MNHLSPDELVDAADRQLAAERQAHLDACPRCREDAARLGALMREASGVSVPEPSPLFWEHLSRRVHEAVAREPQHVGGWSRWTRWQALVPVGALAVALLALVGTVSRPPEPTTPLRPGAVAALPADVLLSDDSLDLVAELVGPLDWDTAGEAGLSVSPGDVDAVLLTLDDDERRALSQLLLGELARTKS